MSPRTRLLGSLPDASGWVVWLEAPYGYGKSVLAAQWAQTLEADGRVVKWLSIDGRGLKESIARLVALPVEAGWDELRDALWADEALVVIEDLAEPDDVTPLLADVRGLLLLASRGRLTSPELPRLATRGRLVHLRAADLMFTLDEAHDLFPDPAAAEDAWRASGGWALPLHFAALTGETADSDSLVAGVRSSLPSEVWTEALLQSTLPYLPFDAATEASRELAAAGFTQEIDAGYRLHPLMAESLRRAYADETRAAVLSEQARLPLELRAEALACAGLRSELTDLIENDPVPGRLGSLDPAGLLRWEAFCVGSPGPGRLLAKAWALSTLGDAAAAVTALREVAAHPDATPSHVLTALSWELYELEPGEVERAEATLASAEDLMAVVPPRAAVSFLVNSSIFFYKRQDWARVAAMLKRSLELLGDAANDEDYTSVIRHKLAEVEWELHGDLHAFIAASEEQYRVQIESNPYNALVAQQMLGWLRALISDPRAGTHLEEAAAGSAHNSFVAACSAAELATLKGDTAAFPGIVARFRPWRTSFPETETRIRELWARSLRREGAADAALRVLEESSGPGADGERALALAALGRAEEAAAAMPDPAATKLRRTRLELHAANYLLSRDASQIDEIVSGTLAGATVLPGLLPLEALPVERPELAAAYPMSELLAARWTAAIQQRLDEVPPLVIELLGGFRVRLLDQEIALSTKHREILCLLALGLPRSQIGEMLWPEAPQKKVQNNLHVQLTLLRRAIEPWGVKTYVGDTGLERCRVDLTELQSALDRGDVAMSLRLYREPVADGVDVSEVDEFRDQLRARVVEVWRAAAAQAAPQAALELLERVLAVDPYDEETLGETLKLLVSLGREREARRRFDEFAKRLKQEFGHEPMPATWAWQRN